MNSPTRVKQAVPFFWVSDMEASVQYYVEGLGFGIAREWIEGGRRRWCWVEGGGAALMLQEARKDGGHPFRASGKLGQGVTIYFICEDAPAIYREIVSRGIVATRPVVGNGMWVTELTDPDGYRLAFESVTDAPEESTLDGEEGNEGRS